MTREIKFRAWDKENKGVSFGNNGKMIYRDFGIMFEDTVDNGYILDYIGDDIYKKAKYNRNEDIIFMQYTGLKDKNGKEIYEGDIIRDNSRTDFLFTVEWENKMTDEFLSTCGWCLRKIKGSWESKKNYDGLSSYDYMNYEIIGNIYENPELLINQDK